MEKYSIHKGDLILINSNYKYYPEKNIKFKKFRDFDIKLEEKTFQALVEVLERINSKEKIVPVSGFRPNEEQREIYNGSLIENGEEFTKKYVALPGHSEHETGLAIDLGLNEGEIDFIRPYFPYDGICQEFRELAPHYGFIERYRENKDHITKISQEPWHFRYVGFPHSLIMKERDFCLEEYHEFLQKYDYKNPFIFKVKYKIYFSRHLVIEDRSEVSGNNINGYIITKKL